MPGCRPKIKKRPCSSDRTPIAGQQDALNFAGCLKVFTDKASVGRTKIVHRASEETPPRRAHPKAPSAQPEEWIWSSARLSPHFGVVNDTESAYPTCRVKGGQRLATSQVRLRHRTGVPSTSQRNTSPDWRTMSSSTRCRSEAVLGRRPEDDLGHAEGVFPSNASPSISGDRASHSGYSSLTMEESDRLPVSGQNRALTPGT